MSVMAGCLNRDYKVPVSRSDDKYSSAAAATETTNFSCPVHG